MAKGCLLNVTFLIIRTKIVLFTDYDWTTRIHAKHPLTGLSGAGFVYGLISIIFIISNK